MKKIKKENQLVAMFKGLIIAIVFTIIALSLFSVLLVYTNLGEDTIEPVILVITGVSILIGSSYGVQGIKNKGLLKGGVIGGFYIFCIYLVSSIIECDFSLNQQAIIMIIVGVVGGILGGIIGVNKKIYKKC